MTSIRLQSDGLRAAAKASPAILFGIVFLLAMTWSAPTIAQATGYIQMKFAKAGLVAGLGGGTGILTYRGRRYPFRVTGLSLGFTAGASIGRFEGRAMYLREVADFAGTYSGTGAGGALAGGIGAVHLRNEKGVRIELRGPRAGVEFGANLSGVVISFR